MIWTPKENFKLLLFSCGELNCKDHQRLMQKPSRAAANEALTPFFTHIQRLSSLQALSQCRLLLQFLPSKYPRPIPLGKSRSTDSFKQWNKGEPLCQGKPQRNRRLAKPLLLASVWLPKLRQKEQALQKLFLSAPLELLLPGPASLGNCPVKWAAPFQQQTPSCSPPPRLLLGMTEQLAWPGWALSCWRPIRNRSGKAQVGRSHTGSSRWYTCPPWKG